RCVACSRNQPDSPRSRLWNVSIDPSHTCRLPCLDLREISCCASGYLDAGEDRRRQDRGSDPYTSLMQLRDKPVSSRLSTSSTTDQCSVGHR
ncbi:hypothetical protein CCUS01_01315, partial [Colletotrichum cuscutae]